MRHAMRTRGRREKCVFKPASDRCPPTLRLKMAPHFLSLLPFAPRTEKGLCAVGLKAEEEEEMSLD